MHGATYAWYEWAGIAAGILTVLGFTLWMGLGVFRWLRRLVLVHEYIVGRKGEAGLPDVPSIAERFDDVNAHLGKQDVAIADLKRIVTNGLSEGVNEANRGIRDLKSRVGTLEGH